MNWPDFIIITLIVLVFIGARGLPALGHKLGTISHRPRPPRWRSEDQDHDDEGNDQSWWELSALFVLLGVLLVRLARTL